LSLQATAQSNPSATKVALSLPFFNSTWLDLSALFVPLFIGSHRSLINYSSVAHYHLAPTTFMAINGGGTTHH